MLTPKMKQALIEEIYEKSRKLMLSRKVVELCEQEATPKQAEFILHVLNEELESRESNRQKRLISRAGFPTYKTFSGYEYC